MKTIEVVRNDVVTVINESDIRDTDKLPGEEVTKDEAAAKKKAKDEKAKKAQEEAMTSAAKKAEEKKVDAKKPARATSNP